MKTFKTPKGTELPFLNLKGKDYLQVMHRLVWFREEHPDWSIVTSLVESNDKYVVARSEIIDSSNRVIATAHKREDYAHFGDAIEKSEAGAIGRALSYCGYGTQFAPELDEEDRIVDAPVPPKVVIPPTPRVEQAPSVKPFKTNPSAKGISEAQGKRLFAIMKSHSWEAEQLKTYLKSKYGLEHSLDLNRQQYEELCDQVLPHLSFDEAMNKTEDNSPLPPSFNDGDPFL